MIKNYIFSFVTITMAVYYTVERYNQFVKWFGRIRFEDLVDFLPSVTAIIGGVVSIVMIHRYKIETIKNWLWYLMSVAVSAFGLIILFSNILPFIPYVTGISLSVVGMILPLIVLKKSVKNLKDSLILWMINPLVHFWIFHIGLIISINSRHGNIIA